MTWASALFPPQALTVLGCELEAAPQVVLCAVYGLRLRDAGLDFKPRKAQQCVGVPGVARQGGFEEPPGLVQLDLVPDRAKVALHMGFQ